MHGLFNSALQVFLAETYGQQVWDRIAKRADLPDDGFESMLVYPDDLTHRTVAAAEKVLEKPAPSLLEDMGTFLVSNRNRQALRRLLRFSGDSFSDFLNGLEDLRDRARLAVPDLDTPILEVTVLSGKQYRIDYRWHWAEGIHVVAGLLRAMADDYGALAFTEVCKSASGEAYLRVALVERSFAQGRAFALGEGA